MFHAQLEIFSTLNTDKVAVKRPRRQSRVLTTVSLSQDLWRAAARKQSFKIDFGWDYLLRCTATTPPASAVLALSMAGQSHLSSTSEKAGGPLPSCRGARGV